MTIEEEDEASRSLRCSWKDHSDFNYDEAWSTPLPFLHKGSNKYRIEFHVSSETRELLSGELEIGIGDFDKEYMLCVPVSIGLTGTHNTDLTIFIEVKYDEKVHLSEITIKSFQTSENRIRDNKHCSSSELGKEKSTGLLGLSEISKYTRLFVRRKEKSEKKGNCCVTFMKFVDE